MKFEKRDPENRSDKTCCCGSHNASNPKRNRHHNSTRMRLAVRTLRRFKRLFRSREQRMLDAMLDAIHQTCQLAVAINNWKRALAQDKCRACAHEYAPVFKRGGLVGPNQSGEKELVGPNQSGEKELVLAQEELDKLGKRLGVK